MKCKDCCFIASDTLLGDCICELRTSNPANWRTIFPQESECKYPTERRAALMEQLSPEDREALELGCRVRALTTIDAEFRGRLNAWSVFPRGAGQMGAMTTAPLDALRAAHIGDGWDEVKGEKEEVEG